MTMQAEEDFKKKIILIYKNNKDVTSFNRNKFQLPGTDRCIPR